MYEEGEGRREKEQRREREGGEEEAERLTLGYGDSRVCT